MAIAATGSDIRSFSRSVVVATDPMTAWEGWTSAEGLTAWWPVPEVNIDLRIGGPLELHFDPSAPEGEQGSEGCAYLGYVPGEMVSFTWNAPPHLPLRTENTWVVITFDAVDGGTEVRLVHTGFLTGDDWDDYMAYFERAWEAVLGLQRDHYGAGALGR